jgi:hypothetical protein
LILLVGKGDLHLDKKMVNREDGQQRRWSTEKMVNREDGQQRRWSTEKMVNKADGQMVNRSFPTIKPGWLRAG